MNLPSSYFPTIEYFFHFLKNDSIVITTHEIFTRQTFRNRCVIINANGLQNLSVPVARDQGHDLLTKDIRISYAEDWIKNHLRSIESAYRRTPFYEYYIDQLTKIIETKCEYLIDLNSELLKFISDKIGLSCSIGISESDETISQEANDLVNPKTNSLFQTKEYLQTFTERFGFQNNLSILDLLFNEGPNSICILEESFYIS